MFNQGLVDLSGEMAGRFFVDVCAMTYAFNTCEPKPSPRLHRPRVSVWPGFERLLIVITIVVPPRLYKLLDPVTILNLF